jgi:phenylacetate-coenzyme A ligase PaaK-like adenylate-forming protein
MIAVRCPHYPDNYHIMAHKLGLEFLNEQGTPCLDGEFGQIVITDYFNRKMPLIRYAIGDLATQSFYDTIGVLKCHGCPVVNIWNLSACQFKV